MRLTSPIVASAAPRLPTSLSAVRGAASARRRAGLMMRRRQAGMSLIEVLLVVTLIAGVSVLAASAMGGGFKGMQLRSASKEIAAQLRYTRSQAINTGEPQRFTIDPQSHAWTAPNGRHGEVPAAIGVKFTGARQAQERQGEGAVMFFPDGAATGGRVHLSIEKSAYNIDVAWLTGQVKLKRVEAEQ